MDPIADICIVGEGSYPYFAGGVSQWVHELITAHPEFTFHVITLVPPHPELKFYYQFPKNVVGSSVYIVQDLPEGALPSKLQENDWKILLSTLKGLVDSPSFEEFDPIIDLFKRHRKILGKRILCESMETWNLFLQLYQDIAPSNPFKAYFATIYTLSRSLYSILLPELPKAKIYHALCTGYAGFILYRAHQELRVPCIVTEQGIYTNERRIEIFMSDWIAVMGSLDLALEGKKKTLKDFWLNTFFSLAHACYLSCDEILSTYDGNHAIQLAGGADPKKVSTIVHGIDFNNYSSLREKRRKVPQCVAFVGRIVPIKDVKTFIRACKIVKQKRPDVRLFAAGSSNEDPVYYEECLELAKNLGLEDTLQFMGHINYKEFLADLDILVLTSISEAQPLVILEAGAAGVPAVATNVGGCEQLLYGDENESPPLGHGGIVTPLRDPEATANAILKLLNDQEFYQKCSEAIAARIEKYYVFQEEQDRYTKIYQKYL
jgi:polysaccharide biosynthesis protein PelF